MFNIMKRSRTTAALALVWAGVLFSQVGCVKGLGPLVDLLDEVELEDVMELFEEEGEFDFGDPF